MLNLSGDTWQRWKSLHAELEATARWPLAGLFRGHEGDNYRQAARKVLYTGKATRGEYKPGGQDNNHFDFNKKAFWNFARRLNGLTGGRPDQLENIAWSNLCKIGTAIGNPNDQLVEMQAGLAAETLRQEWTELRPTLVVCVTEGFHEDLIRKALNVKQGEDSFEEIFGKEGTFWLRPALKQMPAILWMKHPQGKRSEYLDSAAALAKDMLG